MTDNISNQDANTIFARQIYLAQIFLTSVLNKYNNANQRRQEFISENIAVTCLPKWDEDKKKGNTCVMKFYLEKGLFGKKLFRIKFMFKPEAILDIYIKDYDDKEFLKKYEALDSVYLTVHTIVHKDILDKIKELTGVKDVRVNLE
jgi:hypothetical protein